MKSPRPFVSLCLLAGFALPLRAAPLDWPLPAAAPADAHVSAARLEIAHQALDRYVDDGRYSGYIALLARDGKIVDWHAHGWQNIDAKTPLQPDSIVRIYSMSKVITSAAILTLVEDGKLKLSDPIESFFPVLKNRQVLVGGTAAAPQLAPAEHPITVLNLLTHTAGYYYDADWSAGNDVAIELFRRANLWEAANLDDFVQRVAEIPLLDQPGTRFRYGINMDLLGAIIEKVSGQRLDRYLQDRIFTPLGMRDTAFWVPPEKQNRLALLYAPDASGKLAIAPPFPAGNPQPDGTGFASGGGGLFSTAADYVRFAQMLLNEGELDGVRVLGRKTVELMRQNHIAHLANPHPFDNPAQGYGLGVRMITDLGRSTMAGSKGMWGWDGAATTIFWMDPQERSVVMLLTQHFPFDEGQIFTTFVDTYYAAFND